MESISTVVVSLLERCQITEYQYESVLKQLRSKVGKDLPQAYKLISQFQGQSFRRALRLLVCSRFPQEKSSAGKKGPIIIKNKKTGGMGGVGPKVAEMLKLQSQLLLTVSRLGRGISQDWEVLRQVVCAPLDLRSYSLIIAKKDSIELFVSGATSLLQIEQNKQSIRQQLQQLSAVGFTLQLKQGTLLQLFKNKQPVFAIRRGSNIVALGLEFKSSVADVFGLQAPDELLRQALGRVTLQLTQLIRSLRFQILDQRRTMRGSLQLGLSVLEVLPLLAPGKAEHDSLNECCLEFQEQCVRYEQSLEQSDVVWLFLDGQGKVKFLSGQLNQRLRGPLFASQNELTYTTAFRDNSELSQLIGQAVKQNKIIQKPVRLTSHGFQVDVFFLYTDESKLFEVNVAVSNMRRIDRKRGQQRIRRIFKSSSINLSSDHSSGNQQDDQSEGAKGTRGLFQKLQKEQPGISRDGWLSMWISAQKATRKDQLGVTKSESGGESSPGSSRRSKKGNSMTFSQDFGADWSEISPLVEGFQGQDSFCLDVLRLQGQPQRMALACRIFRQRGFLRLLKVSSESFLIFLYRLQEQYNVHNNSFHNFLHGLNVMHSAHMLSAKVKPQLLDEAAALSVVLGALCHDVGHTGRTNIFEVNSRSALARLYNDRSPLQNFHASKAFQVMENSLILASLLQRRDVFTLFRQRFISNILYTDITQHFPLLNGFSARRQAEDFGKGKDDILLLMGMLIHSADFAGTIQPFEIARQWALRVNLQFDSQYKQEAELGIPQTPFFKDLDKPEVMAKGETGFIKIIVRPLYKQLNEFMAGGLNDQVAFLDDNILCWQRIAQGQGESMPARKPIPDIKQLKQEEEHAS